MRSNKNQHLLRWLIWFPLLSIEELTRLEQARQNHHPGEPGYTYVAAQLNTLRRAGLITHLIINEPGWPPHHHRYQVTDAGFSLFAALSHPPLSLSQLARAYPVTRPDIIARLAHLPVHLVLADVATKLVAEGIPQGLPLISYRQPWHHFFVTPSGKRSGVHLDAAFLLTTPHGNEYAFSLYVDRSSPSLFNEMQARHLFMNFCTLRQHLQLSQENTPHLLIITHALHQHHWASLAESVSEQDGTPILDGYMTTRNHIQSLGIHGCIWSSFASHIQTTNEGTPSLAEVPLSFLLRTPIRPFLSEILSQKQRTLHLFTKHIRTNPRPISTSASYIGQPLCQDLETIYWPTLSAGLQGTIDEQQEAVALLNLALSVKQKAIMSWLAQHPLLTLHHLALLLMPECCTPQGIQRQMPLLLNQHLIQLLNWKHSHSWQTRERYLLTEPALRYIALREGKPGTHYLLTKTGGKADSDTAYIIQRGVSGLFAQMEHTHGLYESICDLMVSAYKHNIPIIAWKNAHETVASYRDGYTGTLMQIRPDGALLYQKKNQDIQSLLIEYDRATTSKRECYAKYRAYVDYLQSTGRKLPPILVITQHTKSATHIRRCIDAVIQESQIPLVVLIILQAMCKTFDLALIRQASTS